MPKTQKDPASLGGLAAELRAAIADPRVTADAWLREQYGIDNNQRFLGLGTWECPWFVTGGLILYYVRGQELWNGAGKLGRHPEHDQLVCILPVQTVAEAGEEGCERVRAADALAHEEDKELAW